MVKAKTVNPIQYRDYIKRARFNVPFGYKDSKGEFRAFVNIDVDDDGNYVYSEGGNIHSIAQRIVREKKIQYDEWFQHIVYVNQYGKLSYLSKIQLEEVVKKKKDKKKVKDEVDTEVDG